MSNICDFEIILKTECKLLHFTRNCRITNLDDFEGDDVNTHLWRVGLLNVKEKGVTICYIMTRCLVMFLRGGKVNFVEYWWKVFVIERKSIDDCWQNEGEHGTLQTAKQLRGETFRSLLVAHYFLLVACYFLLVACYFLLVAR